jgi:hypothetical protein
MFSLTSALAKHRSRKKSILNVKENYYTKFDAMWWAAFTKQHSTKNLNSNLKNKQYRNFG